MMNYFDSSYTEINSSFELKLVYRLGSDSGFFSEINNMVLAMIYCIENNIQFQLYSKKGSYSADTWLDYFRPFTIHKEELFHYAFNHRPYIYPLPETFIIEELLEKRNKEKVLLTQHVWPFINDDKVYNVNKTINNSIINGNLLEVAQVVIKSIWHYNEKTSNDISSSLKELKLPAEYDALHIRRGDKITETKNSDIKEYFERLDSIIGKNQIPIFIATDDYSVIIEAKTKYPKKKYFTLICQRKKALI
jgi:hypothetical protein